MLNYATEKDEKLLTMKLSFCFKAHMLVSNIYFFRATLQIGLRSKVYAEKYGKKNDWNTIHDLLCNYHLQNEWRGNEINFNDPKSPETPSAAMNYATHQKRGKHSSIHHDDARIFSLSSVSSHTLFTACFLILFYFCCLELKEYPTIVVINDSIF